MLTKLLALLIVAVLFLVGCSSSQVVSSLGLVVSAAEAALPIIAASSGTSLDPAVVAKILTYLHSVNQAVTQASVILSAPGTTQQHAVKIAAAFAGVAKGCNCVPPGTPSNILAVIDGVVNAVANFLANFPATGPSASPSAAPAGPPIKLSGSDKAELVNIQRRAELQVLAVDAVKSK